MKNEVSERREGSVLYEPPEPLFPDLPHRRRISYIRMAAFAVIVCVFILIWVISASASVEEAETEQQSVGNATEEENIELTHPSTESKTSETEQKTEMLEETSLVESETESVTDIVTERETAPVTVIEFIESDLSEAERGDSYIVNYTDNAVEIAELLDRGFVDSEEKHSSAPVVMILHTHTSEAYFGGRSEYLDGVISVGDALAQKLNALGLTTLHCTIIHDGGDGNAYITARETIEMMLKIYPSIKYVIDLHRMELESDGTPIKTASADGLAQIRLTVGAGSVGWQENLSLALSLRQRLNENDTRICMPPTISPSRYNSDMSRYYLMVDIGSLGNSAREARLSAERLASALCDTILKK